MLYHYPASQSALAQVVQHASHAVAERFELYVDGIELANGYHELLDANVLRQRNAEANRQRVADGKYALPEDSRLLAAMEHGLPRLHRCRPGFRSPGHVSHRQRLAGRMSSRSPSTVRDKLVLSTRVLSSVHQSAFATRRERCTGNRSVHRRVAFFVQQPPLTANGSGGKSVSPSTGRGPESSTGVGLEAGPIRRSAGRR